MLRILLLVGLFSTVFSDDSVDGIHCTDAGYFPNPYDCTKYYVCVDWFGNGKRMSIFHFDCAYGTVYDPTLFVCNHPEWIKPPPACAGGHLVVPGPVNVLPDPVGPLEEVQVPAVVPQPSGTDEVIPEVNIVPEPDHPAPPAPEEVVPPVNVVPEPVPVATSEVVPDSNYVGTPQEVVQPVDLAVPDSGSVLAASAAPEFASVEPESASVAPEAASAAPESASAAPESASAAPESASAASESAGAAPESSSFSPTNGEQPAVEEGTTVKEGEDTSTASSVNTTIDGVVVWVVVPDGLLNGTQSVSQEAGKVEEEPNRPSENQGLAERPAEVAGPETSSANVNEAASAAGNKPGGSPSESTGEEMKEPLPSSTDATGAPESSGTTKPFVDEDGTKPAVPSTPDESIKFPEAVKPNPDQPTAVAPESAGTTKKPIVDEAGAKPAVTSSPDDSVKFPEAAKPKPDQPTTTAPTPNTNKPNNSSAIVFGPGELNFQLNCGSKEFLRLPTACDRFYKCYWINSESRLGIDLFQCDRGLLFDDVRKRCDKAENVDCPLKPTYSTVPGSLYDCPEPGHFPYESDCIRFYRCIEVKPNELKGLLYRCPENYGFSEETRRCEKLAKLPPCGRPHAKNALPLYDIPFEETTVILEKDLDRFFRTKGFFIP